jgi:Divergent InlB B-repeat domain
MGFSGDCTDTGSCELTMDEGKSVTATFDLEPVTEYALSVSKIGAGQGTVTSEPGGIDCGSECSAEFEEGSKVKLSAEAESGSEFRQWIGACSGASTCEVTMDEAKSVNARFSHSRPLLTLEKQGAGAIKSKPKGISCGNTCTAATAQLYKGTTVAISAKAVTGGALEGWEGCDSSTNTGTEGTCTVAMSEARKVKATFKAPAKAIVNPKVLTVSKGPGTGYGTVKGTGIACEAACTSTQVPYFGGETAPPAKKEKAPYLVTLTQIPAVGSAFAGWEDCDEVKEGKCLVSMGKAQSVTARFEAKPLLALTLTKEGYGSVKSKPKGISCGSSSYGSCYSATAALPEDSAVVLSAKAATGAKFSGWEGCKVLTQTELESTCEVTMSSVKAVKATFTAAPKPIVNPQTLTVTKAGTGTGIVKATGIACEAACTSAASAYFGGEKSPPAKKEKGPVLVTLVAIPSAGSDAVVWSGCESEPEGKCVVSMGEAQSVTARFEE